MPIESVLDASRAGLAYERLRMEAASLNIARSNVALAPDAAAVRNTVGVPSAFDASVAGRPALLEDTVETRAVHDPSHPHADADGMVRYPKVDMVQEMTTLMTASRGYEANVRAFNALRGMMLQALEIGAK